jgi:glc operon protein GlcG
MLTTTEAQRILHAAQSKAESMGVKVAISIVDPRGDLITMVRLDGAPYRTVVISRGKAVASAFFGVPSGSLAERAQTPVVQSLVQIEGGHLTPHQGALPIIKDGEIIGAIGTSGALSNEDEDIGQTGIDAL